MLNGCVLSFRVSHMFERNGGNGWVFELDGLNLRGKRLQSGNLSGNTLGFSYRKNVEW